LIQNPIREDLFALRESGVFLCMANHYEALGLGHRQFDGSLTAQDIKQAYRKALLEHHPDKAPTGDVARSVDSITVAYKTLSEPAATVEYDRELRLQLARNKGDDKVFHTGLDVVDLDDLDYDEETGEWWRSCRCGQARGFIITEDELENESRYGELITVARVAVYGSKSCSESKKMKSRISKLRAEIQTAHTYLVTELWYLQVALRSPHLLVAAKPAASCPGRYSKAT
jgi:diphthamide biosynthesis protein 4